ncbi:MAG: COX15/CtaA family protein [Sandaracinaceae bacterium]
MLRRYAVGVLLANLAVIAWGAFVRATGSGAGCGAHWPLCNGEVVPRDPSVETLIELTHRATSGVALLLVIGLVALAFTARPKRHPMRAASVLSLVFILLEAAVGAGLVLFEYVAHDESVARVYWMGAHLVNTFLLIGALTLAVVYAPEKVARPRWDPVGWPIVIGALALLVVGVSGAVTALGDTLFPSGSLGEGIARDFEATAHFLVRLRVWHPITAAISAVVILVAATVTAMRRPDARGAAQVVVVLVCAQIAGGFVNLALLAPVWMQLVHLLLADLTWAAVVVLGARTFADSSESAAIEPVPVGHSQ